MQKKFARRTAAPCFIDSLESRSLLSASVGPALHAEVVATPSTKTAIIAAPHVAKLGQNVKVTVIVSAAKRFGPLQGTVEFLDSGNLIQGSGGPLTLTLNSKNRATYTFGAGDLALTIGTHLLSAEFISSNSLPGSTSRTTNVKIVAPRVKTASDGLEVATVKPGHGRKIQMGQTATVYYTGLLASDGTIFDYSTAHGTAGFPFAVGEGQVITGFDEGTLGMKVGETRALYIPAAIGYGANGAPPSIPGNADLIFLITLLSIS